MNQDQLERFRPFIVVLLGLVMALTLSLAWLVGAGYLS